MDQDVELGTRLEQVAAAGVVEAYWVADVVLGQEPLGPPGEDLVVVQVVRFASGLFAVECGEKNTQLLAAQPLGVPRVHEPAQAVRKPQDDRDQCEKPRQYKTRPDAQVAEEPS